MIPGVECHGPHRGATGMNRKLAAVIVTCFLGTSGARADDVFGRSGLDKLAVYDGSFEIKATYFKTPYGEAHAEDGVVLTRCWRSTDFYSCNQSGKMIGQPQLVVYTYDAKKDEYWVYFIPNNAEHLTSGMRLTTDGKVWTYFAKLKDPKGKEVYLRNINTFTSPDVIDYEEDYSIDGVKWTPMDKGRETRVPAPAS
jgi:hypothetical protein